MRVLAFLVSAGLAAAATPAVAQQSSAPSAKPDPNERICRKPQPVIGTRIPPGRVCKTRAEWDAESREAQQDWKSRHNPASGDGG